MRIIGHRGARNERPENTLCGFISAQNSGCEAFELDIQLSSDLDLMVFHDTTLDRTTGTRGRMSEHSRQSLSQLNANRGHSGLSSKLYAQIPTLRQVFEVSPHCSDWQLEVKSDSDFKSRILLQKLLALLDGVKDRQLNTRITITSSNKRFLKMLNNHIPEFAKGLVVEYADHDPITECQRLNCHLLVINRKLVTQELIENAHLAGLEVSVWTVNSLEEMTKLKQQGVDSVITDIPTLALKNFG